MAVSQPEARLPALAPKKRVAGLMGRASGHGGLRLSGPLEDRRPTPRRVSHTLKEHPECFPKEILNCVVSRIPSLC